MKNRKKSVSLPNKAWNVIVVAVLVAIPVFLYAFRMYGGYLAGSNIDWIKQHTMFPDYFRKLFYETGNPFPQFAAELTGGQNIWNFSYYGLYNPLFAPSYLLPFVSMVDYVQAISFVGQTLSGLLCYKWLRGHFHAKQSLFGAVVFALAVSVIHQYCAQIMFVDYMPFLLMTLLGYDSYCKNKRYGLMMWGVVLMILTSFYYAIASLLVLVIYAAGDWKWHKGEEPICFSFVRHMWLRLYPAVLGGFLAMFYLIPTAFSLLSQREGNSFIGLRKLLIPSFSIIKLLYHPYGVGVSALAVIALCTALFYKKGKERRMAVLLLLLLYIPVFSWLLNGGLYIRDKVFIPALPLLCYFLASYAQRISARVLKPWKILAGFLAAALLLLAGWGGAGGSRNTTWYVHHMLLADLVLCAVLVGVAAKFRIRLFYSATVAVMVITAVYSIETSRSTMMSPAQTAEFNNEERIQHVEEILAKDKGLYRMEVRGGGKYNKAQINHIMKIGHKISTGYSSALNPLYHQFRKEIGMANSARNKLIESDTNNLLFRRFMGIKYMVWKQVYAIGDNAPLLYLTDQIMSEGTFNALPWYNKQLNLVEYAVVPDGSDARAVTGRKDHTRTASLPLEQVDEREAFNGQGESSVQYRDGKIYVNSNRDIVKKIKLESRPEKFRYMFLSCHVRNLRPEKSVKVTIQKERNVLSEGGENYYYYNGNETFHFTFWVNPDTKHISIHFGPGKYVLEDIDIHTGTVDNARSKTLYQEPLQNARKLASGDGYEGEYESGNEKWLITSIPYDKVFTVLVDGEPVPVTRVNRVFVGARVPAGSHHLEVVYCAQGAVVGWIVSGVALVFVFFDFVRRRRR